MAILLLGLPLSMRLCFLSSFSSFLAICLFAKYLLNLQTDTCIDNFFFRERYLCARDKSVSFWILSWILERDSKINCHFQIWCSASTDIFQHISASYKRIFMNFRMNF